MRRIAILLLGAAAIVGTTVEIANAADGCGRGRFWNGYRCVSAYRAAPPPVYAAPPGYGAYGYGHPSGRWERPIVTYGNSGRNVTCANPHYTVQDGICKPYTGR